MAGQFEVYYKQLHFSAITNTNEYKECCISRQRKKYCVPPKLILALKLQGKSSCHGKEGIKDLYGRNPGIKQIVVPWEQLWLYYKQMSIGGKQ